MVEHHHVVLVHQPPHRILRESLQRPRFPCDAHVRMRLRKSRGRRQHRRKSAIVFPSHAPQSYQSQSPFPCRTRRAEPCYTTFASLKCAISFALYPSSLKISSLCSPSIGGRRISPGVRLNSIGGPDRESTRLNSSHLYI